MGKFIVLGMFPLFLASNCEAQFERGRSEIGLVAGIGPGGKTNTFFGAHSDYLFASNYYLSLATVYDYYILHGLSLEPEASVTWYKDYMTIHLLAHLSYTQKLGQSPVALFGKIGYGVANDSHDLTSLSVLTRALPVGPLRAILYREKYRVRLSEDFNAIRKSINRFKAGIVSAGIGTKMFVGRKTLLRLELNYRTFIWNQTGSPGISTGISFLI